MKKLILMIIAMWGATHVMAQVTFKAEAPQVVSLDERFRLTYEINAEGEGFKSSAFSDFDVQQGPSTGSSTSISIVNGHVQQSKTMSYTYVLTPKRTGTFTIPPARIMVKGKEYKSNALTIEVVSGNGKKENQTSRGQTEGVRDADIFVRVETSKRNAYKGEGILATVKLYTKVQLQQLSDFKMPHLDNFWKEDVEIKDNKIQWQRENVNGEIYNTGVISQFLLVPQKSGELTIDPIQLEVIALQEVRQRGNRNPFNDPFFDDFFSGSSYQQVKKQIKSQPVKINVKDIPASAATTGDLDINSVLSKTTMKANESVSLKITVSGKGNLKQIEPFKIDFSPDFEVFDPDVKQNIKVTPSGISGSKTFEYLIIPRHEGKYEIPSVSLTAFNPTTGKLQELKTPTYELEVKGTTGHAPVSGMDYSRNQQDIKYIGKDIRYIKTNDFTLSKGASPWFGSTSFYISYAVSMLVFAAAVFLLRKQRQDKIDAVGYRKRKAAAMAKKRLKVAERYLQEGNRIKFYEELLQGIWGYVGNKLNLPQSSLSKEKIREALTARQVTPDTTEQLVQIIEKCEMTRYAPVSGHNTLSEDYQTTVDIISRLEEEIKL